MAWRATRKCRKVGKVIAKRKFWEQRKKRVRREAKI